MDVDSSHPKLPKMPLYIYESAMIFCFQDLKECSKKRFGLNYEVIDVAEMFFEEKDHKDVEMLETRWADCITLKKIVIRNKSQYEQQNQFAKKSCRR